MTKKQFANNCVITLYIKNSNISKLSEKKKTIKIVAKIVAKKSQRRAKSSGC